MRARPRPHAGVMDPEILPELGVIVDILPVEDTVIFPPSLELMCGRKFRE